MTSVTPEPTTKGYQRVSLAIFDAPAMSLQISASILRCNASRSAEVMGFVLLTLHQIHTYTTEISINER
ncbi:hypothetical protein Z945_1154 [Sulfitobacter noctilucae]|nr:hypothetical protein Z945_1154 [Sulfitobacter noctilucae]